jgi:PASTA domain
MVEEQHPRIWPLAVTVTAVFLIGGMLGYLVGRPSRSPAPHRALQPGEVRVPSLTGLRMTDARRVLAPLGLHSRTRRTAGSSQFAPGFVIAQAPAPGTGIKPPGVVGIEVSSGPGPPPGPMFLFARSVLIPINRVGPYRWVSPRVALDGPPVSLGANTRVIGRATVTPYEIDATHGQDGSGMSISFRVTSYRGAAWYAIVRAFGRQRESAATTPHLSVRRARGGRDARVTGFGCRDGGSQSAALLMQVDVGSATSPERVMPRVSVYAFRATIPLPKLNEPTSLTFRVRNTQCQSSPIQIGA